MTIRLSFMKLSLGRLLLRMIARRGALQKLVFIVSIEVVCLPNFGLIEGLIDRSKRLFPRFADQPDLIAGKNRDFF